MTFQKRTTGNKYCGRLKNYFIRMNKLIKNILLYSFLPVSDMLISLYAEHTRIY